MKKYFTLLALSFISFTSNAQKVLCEDFNSGSAGNWFTVNCLINKVGAPYKNPLDNTQAISIRDNHAASTFENTADYQNLGKRYLGYCISFDYNVTNDGRSETTSPIHPTLYLVDIAGRTIYFKAYNWVTEGDGWTHVRAPIALSTAEGRYPSNDDGGWGSDVAYTPATFDYIMENSSKIYFSIDIIGSDVTTEDVRFDNICLSQCNDTTSKSCNSNFEFTLTKSTEPDAYISNRGSIRMLDFHPKSTYQINWGDGLISPVFETHKYKTGNYTVRVKEKTEAGTECYSQLKLCANEIIPSKKITTSTDTGCGANFTVTLVSATNRDVEDNNIATIQMKYANPDTKYKIEWGDGNVDGAFYRHHFDPGTNTVCVTETRKDKSICKNCLSICVANPEAFSTGITEEEFADGKISMVPNPARDLAELRFSLNTATAVGIRVFDLSGRLVLDIPTQTFDAGDQKAALPITGLDNGLYVVMLSAGNKQRYEKLAVVR